MWAACCEDPAAALPRVTSAAQIQSMIHRLLSRRRTQAARGALGAARLDSSTVRGATFLPERRHAGGDWRKVAGRLDIAGRRDMAELLALYCPPPPPAPPPPSGRCALAVPCCRVGRLGRSPSPVGQRTAAGRRARYSHAPRRPTPRRSV